MTDDPAGTPSRSVVERESMKRRSVGAKLSIAFGFLVSILMGIGWLGLDRMGQINTELSDILDRRLNKVEWARKVIFHSNLNHQMTTDIFLVDERSEEEIDRFLIRRTQNDNDISSLLKKIEPELDSAEERELFAEVNDTRALANDGLKEVHALIRQRKPEIAKQIMFSKVHPIIENYGRALQAFLRIEETQLREARAHSENSYAAARRISTLFIGLAIALAIVIAVSVTRALVRESEKKEQARMEIRRLNENLEKTVAERTEDLRRLAAIVESSDDSIVGEIVDGTILSWNAAAERMYGYSATEMIGKSAGILAPSDQQDEIQEVLRRVERGEKIEQFETIRVRKDGRQIHVALSVSPIKDPRARVVGASIIARDITERKRAEERFCKAFSASPEPTTIVTMAEGRFIDVNESFLRVTGYQREEVIGRTSLELKFWERPEDRAKLIEILDKQGLVRDLEITFLTRSGARRRGLDSAEIIEVAGQRCILSIFKDITERKLLEEQLRQAQKMESVGRLAGGVAHDFNNLLGVIIGYSEILRERLDRSSPLRNEVLEIKKAGERAASLTRQLLAFSRQQVLEPKILNLKTIMADIENMLRRLIRADIELNIRMAPDLAQVKADQGQIEQVIMNLVVNARAAMPQGGRLSLEARNVELDEAFARQHPPSVPGRYVLLAVTDTGLGMDQDTQAHIFEPFFTTKEKDKGTGLGLSVVYGVVKQSGGYIWVHSELGKGTTFKIYLPLVEGPVEDAPRDTGPTPSLRGSETILLVEDEESLRQLTRRLLVQSGYTVLDAPDAAQALEIARWNHGRIDLLITDMVMPGMSGPVLAERMAGMCPDLKVLFVSGYTEYRANAHGSPAAATRLLQKPFSRDVLMAKVREVLDLRTPVAF
jgi:PAS domain S-box-containing protein